jgi:uncharacterized protein (TIGR02611 family)
MTNRGIRRWHRLRLSRPGRRFQERHDRHRSDDRRRRLAAVAAGVLLIIGGLVLMPLPGPGSLIVVIGLALLAGVSRRAARLLDRGELRLRRGLRWAGRRWKRAPPAARIAAGALIAAGIVAAACAVLIR